MLTARTAYVIVFNALHPEEEHSRLEYWIKVLRSTHSLLVPVKLVYTNMSVVHMQRISNGVESPVPILAVGTHADDRNMTAAHKKKVVLLIDRLKETYPALRDLFLVNARQGKGTSVCQLVSHNTEMLPARCDTLAGVPTGVEDVRNKLVDVAVEHYWLAQPIPKYEPKSLERLVAVRHSRCFRVQNVLELVRGVD
jgi:hypothetical protein